ncbi:MAG: SH3 domain-containing protein [Caldilineaceae bacterium]
MSHKQPERKGLGRKQMGLWAVGVFLGVLLLAGCGGNDPETSTPVVESGQMTPVVSVETATPLPSTITQNPTARPATVRPTPVVLQDILPAALYFLQDGQIQRLESDGLTLTQFTQEAEPITDFDVSPVDARLVYVSGNRLIEANPQYGSKIVKIDGGPVDVEVEGAWAARKISDPHFSPDGSQIAFGLNGVNLIPAGDSTEYALVLASDPYPEPNNPPRSAVRFFAPGPWSPDGTKLLINFSYWPEAGGIAIFDLATSSLMEITSSDPNTTLCCGWAWGQSGSGYIAGDLLIYAIPGLTRVDVSTGDALPLAIGLPPSGPTPGNPIRTFQGAYETADGELLSFVSQPEEFGADAAYTLQRIAPDGSRFTRERTDEFLHIGEVLWAQDGSGAVIRLTDGNQLVWVPRSGDKPVVLSVTGTQLRWAPVVSQDNRQAAAEGERTDSAATETGGTPQANPALAEDAARLIARFALNLRAGPGTLYPVVGSLAADQSVAITGVSPDHTWWQVAVSAEEEATAWVIGGADFVETENADAVAVVIPPPPPAPAGRIFYPGRDPDGRTAIWVQELIPGATPQLVTADASQPSLSADGARLAVRSVRSDILGIGIWEMATAQMTGLTSHQEDTLPTWSPNGDSIVFASTRHGDRRWRVYVQPTEPDAPVQEIAFGLDPDWHPTADRIAYKGCDNRGENCGIWTMDSQGGQQTPVTSNKSDSRPVWSPDGRTIVFMSEERDGNWEIYSVDAGGNVVTRLTINPTNDGLPVVSPDGRQVAFVSNRGGEWGVWNVPIGGGSPERFLRLGTDLPNWLEQSIDWAR